VFSLNLPSKLFSRFDCQDGQLGPQARRPGEQEGFILEEEVVRRQVVQADDGQTWRVSLGSTEGNEVRVSLTLRHDVWMVCDRVAKLVAQLSAGLLFVGRHAAGRARAKSGGNLNVKRDQVVTYPKSIDFHVETRVWRATRHAQLGQEIASLGKSHIREGPGRRSPR